ncbi:MAG: hypothetical protein AAGA53_05965 [Pseudomonadota bacterium]
MKTRHSGPQNAAFSVCASVTHKPSASWQQIACLSYVFTVILAAGMAMAGTAYSQSTEDEESTEDTQSNGVVIDLSPGGDVLTGQTAGGESCQIIIVSPGTINASIENTELSSKVYGGRAGVAQITTTNASYTLSIDQPLGFASMPVGGGDSVNMATFFSGNGATNFSETPGNVPTRLELGTTLIETHVIARRLSGDPFPVGNYSTQLNLRCE